MNVIGGVLLAFRFMKLERTERGNTKAARPIAINTSTVTYIPIEVQTLPERLDIKESALLCGFSNEGNSENKYVVSMDLNLEPQNKF